MTIDKSLKIRSGGLKNRNVLKRIERLEKLKESDRWQDGDSVFGLAKVRVEKLELKRKKKAKVEEDEALEGGELDTAADAGDGASADGAGGGES
jgi:small basic protein (TIGR04137 family)